MRITEDKLRRIIREEVEKEVDEAHAGSLGVSYERPEYQVPGTDEPEPEGEDDFERYVSHRAHGAARYARSGRFKSLAEKHFANLQFPVWTAPYIGNLSDVSNIVDRDGRWCKRMMIMDLERDGKPFLRKHGYSTEGVTKNDLVILYTSGVANRDVLATPWMIIHSIFDSGPCADVFDNRYSGIQKVLNSGGKHTPDYYEGIARSYLKSINDDSEFDWNSYLTMKSARDNKISVAGDALAEMVCQMLLTQGGLKLNLDDFEPGDPQRKSLQWMGDQAKQAAFGFRSRAKGKLIIIAVNQGDL